MKTIYFCTTNSGKKQKLESDLAKYSNDIKLEIVDFEVDEIQDINNENVSKNKVMQVYEKIKKPCLAMDSGLYIESLNNFPGSYVKMTLETIGIDGILKLLERNKNRKFEIRNCLSYYDGTCLQIFSESIKGTIAIESYLGINNDYAWSELYKIIMPEGCDMTLAQMNNQEYLNWDKNKNDNGMIKKFMNWYNNDKIY